MTVKVLQDIPTNVYQFLQDYILLLFKAALTVSFQLPTPVFLLGESHGQRRLVGYSGVTKVHGGHKELDMTE